jgi:hypothetical protein
MLSSAPLIHCTSYISLSCPLSCSSPSSMPGSLFQNCQLCLSAHSLFREQQPYVYIPTHSQALLSVVPEVTLFTSLYPPLACKINANSAYIITQEVYLLCLLQTLLKGNQNDGLGSSITMHFPSMCEASHSIRSTAKYTYIKSRDSKTWQ